MGRFCPDKVRETVQALKEYYGQKGYIDASIQHETILKENEPVFDVDFYIDEEVDKEGQTNYYAGDLELDELIEIKKILKNTLLR